MSKALRGETTVSPETLETFKKDCQESIVKQLTSDRGKYRIRMSGLGRPLCQQVLDKHGIKEDMSYNTLFRFMFGDLTESILMAIMQEAGVEIVDYQKHVELEIAGEKIKGTLDVILRDELGQDKVWDIKSASDWAFNYKFTGLGGYDKLKEDDKEHYLKDAADRIKFLNKTDVKPFKPYKPVAETYKNKGEVISTGNKLLPRECNLCGYRHHCWPNAILHNRVTSRAKSPPQVWYSTLKKKEL